MKQAKKLTIFEYELPIKLEKQKEGGYVAICPIWSACYAQGETIEETVNEISSVATSLIELYKEEEMKIPLKLIKSSQKAESSLSLTFPVIVSN